MAPAPDSAHRPDADEDIHFTEEGHALTASTIGRSFPDVFKDWKAIDSRSVRAAYGHVADR